MVRQEPQNRPNPLYLLIKMKFDFSDTDRNTDNL